MKRNPLNNSKRFMSGDQRKPSAVGKALGTVLLILGIVLIAIGATIGFVQGVKEPAAVDNTAVVTTTSVAETTTTATTATTETQTPPTQAL